jgi:tRNA (cmo5U34)-methyltransferase
MKNNTIKESFNFDNIQDFDNHILKSIPNYDTLNNMILSMSEYFASKGRNIYDLGCSTGKFLKSIPFEGNKIGYDNALIMPKSSESIQFINKDLNKIFDITDACLVYSIFTMQFLDRSSRQKYIDTIYRGMCDGGAFFLCEKVYQQDGLFQEILSFSHYDYKCRHFTEQEIIKKERDLRFIMKPNTHQQNIDMLKKAGFDKVTTFWQSFNFIGIIGVK